MIRWQDPSCGASPSRIPTSWGTWTGFIARHRFAIDTAEGRRLIYDVTTGALAETVPTERDGGVGAGR